MLDPFMNPFYEISMKDVLEHEDFVILGMGFDLDIGTQ